MSKYEQVFAGSADEVWVWLKKNGSHRSAWTRAAPRGHAIFLGRGKVGYDKLALGWSLGTYYLEDPFVDSRRNTDGRHIASTSKLVVKRVDR